MDEGEGDIKVCLGDEEEDPRCTDGNSIPLPLLIGQREIGQRFQHSTTQHFEKWGEESFVQRTHSYLQCDLPPTSKTTYLLAFSPDGTKVASSHGDHNIYVTDVKSGKCICTLRGHPRSPWCVAFHPSSNEIVASGCLGGEVRVWDLKGGSEVWSPDKKCAADKKSVIASLAFHPTDQVLVIATENELYFWDWFCPEPFAKISTASKFEKVKYVEFDPLGSKLITGIAIARPERHNVDPYHIGHSNPINPLNSTNNTNGNSSTAAPEQPFSLRGSIPRSRTTHQIYRMIDRSFRNTVGQTANNLDAVSQPENGSSSSTYQRGFASSVDGRSTRVVNQENDSGTVPGPSSLSELHLQDTTANLRSLRRRYLLPRSSINYFVPTEEEGRMGEMRTFPRPVSDDSASSSSLDSSSSVTSGVSGASHERNTRLSLLWTSRLNRAGGNESDNSAGGTYDLEERRGEGSVMRGGTRGLDTPDENSALGDSARGARENVRERRPTSRVPGHETNPTGSRTASNFTFTDDTSRVNEENEEESEGDLTQRSRQSGQGGRWMYYRGKFPIGVPTRNRGSAIGPSGGASGSSYRASTSRSSSSQPSSVSNRSSIEDSLAIPGPSGLSGSSSVNGHSSSQDPFAQDSSSSGTPQNYSQLDPQFGVRLLSRHIENMQSICRSLSIPRAQLEMTRHRSEISQLQQIRSMLYDIQHQIRSLRASVDQTFSEEYPVSSNDATLNSMAVNAEPLPTELMNTNGGGLTDEVELEVNIGTDDADQFSYTTLAEEDPDQLASDLNNDSIGSIPISAESDVTLEPIPEDEASSRPSSSSSRLGSRTTRNTSRTLRDLAASRARSRRISRNRLVWTGLLRRLPLQRRSSRSRLPTTAPPTSGSSSEIDIGRSVRRREVRESRLDKRRALILSRRSERRNSASGSGLGNESHPPESSGPSLEEHVRRRHTADWQRRLRSINVMDQLRQRNEEGQPTNTGSRTSTTGTAINDYLRSHRRRTNRSNVSGSNIVNSQGISTPVFSLISTVPGITTTTPTTPTTTTSVSTNTELQPSNNTNESDNELDQLPERGTRAGPPTTSLSSRIATMLAQQREARNRNSTIEEAPGPSGLSPSAITPVRASGVFRLRYDSNQRRLGRQNISDTPLDIFEDSFNPSRPADMQEDGTEQDSSNRDYLSLPMYESIRSLRREIMVNRRNRMLRRFPSSLVSGGELAGATLAAINPLLASEQERHRESYRHGGRESYRHTLQLMADRLNHMMNTSLSSSARLREGNAGPFDNEDEEGEVMEHQNLRNVHGASSRRLANQRNSSEMPPYRVGSMLWNNYNSPSSAIDRHMQNLRLLVRLALHLIYQLLNFICNQNLSYEERPISRLPNPFREENELGQRQQRSNFRESSDNNSVANSFEMDIEPGLHNLTTLLETVRMASEELRQDALTNPEPPPREPRPRRDGLRSRRNAMAYSEASTNANGIDREASLSSFSIAGTAPSTVTTTSTSTTAAATSPSDGSHSGSAVRRRLTDFLIRTGGYSLRAQNPNATNGSDPARERLRNEEERNNNAHIQRPLPTSTTVHLREILQRPLPITPTVHLREIRTPFLIPQIVLNDMSNEGAPAASAAAADLPQGSHDSLSPSSEDLGFHLRTFGGIPLRILGRQNAVDRRSPDSEDSSGNENNNANNNNNWDMSNEHESSFRYLSTGRQPFRYWSNLPYSGGIGAQNPILNPPFVDRNLDRDAEQHLIYNQTVFSHYIAASRNISGSLFDPFSPGLCNGNNSYYRIQAWDFRHSEIPDISDSYSNIVVQRCRIHFDASVSVSVDGTLLAAVLPDTKTLTRIGVYSLESKTLGQLLYSSNIGYNIVCVSLSPTMRHLVVGISSHRLGVHHNDKQVIGRIYKLSHSKSSYKGSFPGILKFCKSIELQSEFRQSSLNCIRWIPNPGQGLVYGTNRGQLTVIR